MSQLQLRFDEGHQQRYFPDRRALLECVVRVAAQSRDPRFEVWGEGEPILMADGSSGGRRFELLETLDLSRDDHRQRVLGELESLQRGAPS